MSDCLFCKIINREIPASIVYEDDRVLAFNDINPQGPTHVLVVPKRHVATLNDLSQEDDVMVGELVRRAGSQPTAASRPAGFVLSSTPITTPGRPSSTSTCISSAAAASPGRRANLTHSFSRGGTRCLHAPPSGATR